MSRSLPASCKGGDGLLPSIMHRTAWILGILLMLHGVLYSQQPAATNSAFSRMRGFSLVRIPSSVDGAEQSAWYHSPPHGEGRPLIVSLHTWSGDYNQEDPLAIEAYLRGWNYIHPDFRGPNVRPEACGSRESVADIGDAIRWALKDARADPSEVHVIGVSGGGHATLMAWLKLDLPVKSFHAWVPVTDLREWYRESLERKTRYASDLERIAGGDADGSLDFKQLDARSPIKLPFEPHRREGSTLNLYAGVHDGHSGSVPISHTLSMYNRMAELMHPANTRLRVSDAETISLLAAREMPDGPTASHISGRKVHLHRHAEGLRLTVFEGGHEMLSPVALALTGADPLVDPGGGVVLTMGDSNGAAADGWPARLQAFLPHAVIVNRSAPGNTIGFDNNGRIELNALRTLRSSLDSAEGMGVPRLIVVGLGTNDAKRVYADRQEEVATNLDSLIRSIRSHGHARGWGKPEILVLGIPPVEEWKADASKYGGISGRIGPLNKGIRSVCESRGVAYLDTGSVLSQAGEDVTKDGIHLAPESQHRLAAAIAGFITSKESK